VSTAFTATPITSAPEHLARVKYDTAGLVPAIIQEAGTGAVLMLAYMNDDALRQTLETGRTWFWSRSRQEYWCKGETSGDRQYVREAYYDCDGDTLLFVVDQEGKGACHTGERTCFFRGELEPAAPYEALGALERVLEQRARERPDGSYTTELLADPPRIGEKVREEADEVARAAAGESDDRVAEEAADVLYHLAVLLRSRGLSLDAAERVLDGRRR